MAKHPGDRLEELLLESARFLEREQAEEALASAQEACALAPRSVPAHCILAEALISLHREDEALEAFQRALSFERNDLDALWGAADLLIHHETEDPASVEEGLELCRRGIRAATKLGEEQIVAELTFLEATALSFLGQPREALTKLEEARKVLRDDTGLLLERATLLFDLCRFDEAEQDFRALLREDDELAWAHHYLGLIEERRGNLDAAESHFEFARESAPEEFPDPIRLSEEEFDQAVEDALDELPEQVRRYLDNVAIAVDPFPPVEELQGPEPLSPLILGVFRGTPFPEKSTFDPWSHFPNSIVLYQRNLERFASDREELIEEIAITLLHEVGHFLGFDEDDLRERNLH